MSIRVALHHQTDYFYDRDVTLGPQVVRLRPAPHCRTPILSYSMQVEPGPPGTGHFINWQQDPHSNYLARLVFPEKTRRFSVTVDLVADMTVINPLDFFLEQHAETFPFEYGRELGAELMPYFETLSPGDGAGPRFEAVLSGLDRSPGPSVMFLAQANQAVNRALQYNLRMDPGIQTPEETLEKGSGSCRDMAWLLVQVLRRSGLAARFVSGYSIQLVADLKPVDVDAPAGVVRDVTDLHAWCEVYLPGAGWVGLDATSGLFCGEGHLPLACSPNPTSAAPITGGVEACQSEFRVSMTLERIQEDPRVTKPYTDAQWSAIVETGRHLDERIRSGDVRLSMGGEPTFVSIEDREKPEWNVAAVGGVKRKLAENLIRRLRNRFGAGGLLHYGQGKWYPGEPLPRWAHTLSWRRDGEAIWSDDRLLADIDTDYGFAHRDAERFIAALTANLQIDSEYVNPAFEDEEYVKKELERHPVNISTEHNPHLDAIAQARFKRLRRHQQGEPVGYILPLARSFTRDGPTWQSGLWMLRGRRIPLVPGDSPIGLRLPLDALPWAKDSDLPVMGEEDPFAPRSSIVPYEHAQRRVHQEGVPGEGERQQIQEQTVGDTGFSGYPGHAADRMPMDGESAGWVIRTALCVEAREGRLYVFLPPVRAIEDYLDLVWAIETTARDLDLPVVLEGYTPPTDPRVETLRVTPDPGVIEVNIHPALTWDQLLHDTETLYEEARQCRLGTEKFMLDGRHTGTGGGNHVVIGGITPADSPLLRRPDLLRSLVSYWNNHPSLSYLFSGMFIGPTSQAPRVDEGRTDAIYELEIANRLVPEPEIDPASGRVRNPELGSAFPPWLVDRIYRHLLTDLTGNTHRAEFCIDKLFSPDSATGRLGLLEFRGFEMPPHWQMSIAQILLLRALILRFWEKPIHPRLKRWGTQLHDQFLLPRHCREDFSQVLDELQEHGIAIDSAWYDPFFEFRFPVHGRVTYDGITIELRQAIEPWLVLGEEPAGGATARYVDSSVERMQVRVSGMSGGIGGRHGVAVNGILLPLTSTGASGEYVAGLRFRAWQPVAALHPTIEPHVPLMFDLVDFGSEGLAEPQGSESRVTGRAIGGCTYHAAHPGGRNYETHPVNALEAEARRMARFFPHGHSPGRRAFRQPVPSLEMPRTLDLRRYPADKKGTVS